MARITGIDFPFRRAGGKFPAVAEDDYAVKASIRQIIETSQGERPMRPNAGSRVMEMLFENNTQLLAARVQREVRRAVREQEKRVSVVQVNVDVDSSPNGNTVRVDVIYRLAGRLQSTSTTMTVGDTG